MFENEFNENLSKYENPEEYDKSYSLFKSDLAYIQGYLKNEQTIIELACGTGRLALPLANQGHTVYGVDIDEGMLNYAKKKAESQDIRLHLALQDCTQLDLPIKSNFIYMTGNSFQHFLSNESQNALLQSVKKHLNTGGEFVFDTRNPILSELAMIETTEEFHHSPLGEKVTIQSREEYDPLLQLLTCTSVYSSDTNQYQDSIKLRYTYPLEMKRLLDQNGFEITSIYGSWEKQSFAENSISMIVHAKLK